MDQLSIWRQELHQIPELGNHEYMTTAYLKQELENMGYHPESLLETGCHVFIKGLEDRTIAFRSDIDALSVNEKSDYCVKSRFEGKMHACGHDGHMAMLLGLARALVGKTPKYNILLIFQPAEEEPGGAKPLIEAGLLEKYHVEAIFGYHVMPQLNKGVIATKAGPLMAECGELDIEIEGLSSHAGMPHVGHDAIIVATQMINMYQTIISRLTSPLQNAIIHIGQIKGGTARNSLAPSCELHGTIRAYDESVFASMIENMRKINKGLEMQYDVKISLHCEPMYPPVINDFEMVDQLKGFMDLEVLKEPLMLAEDFSFYQKEVPGVFLFLGVGDEKHQASLHAPEFNFEDDALEYGVEGYLKIVENFKL